MRSSTLRTVSGRIVLICVALLFVLSGCGSSGSKGDFEAGGGSFKMGYIEEGSTIGDQFAFTGHTSYIDLLTMSGSFRVCYGQVEGSGWVLWADNRYAYTETDVGAGSMQAAAMGFGMQLGKIETYELDKW